MNLNTTYLGLQLRSPLVISASPLSKTVDDIKRMEDAGAGAVVLYSLFEEQVRTMRQFATYCHDHPHVSASEAVKQFESAEYPVGIDDYLNHIHHAKESVDIPIIASLNCADLGDWVEAAAKMEQAGADALELNIYFMPTDMDMTAEQAEDIYLRVLKAVKATVDIPVAVKLSPFFTNVAHMGRRLDKTGANGLVLFNRFCQPDFDPKTLRVVPNIQLSTPYDLRLPMHWIAILYGHVKADLAATGGIYTAEDVVKVLMVGAKVAMMASVLIKEGIDYLYVLDRGLREWLDQNDYGSVASLQGLVSQFNSKDPGAFERSEYVQAILSLRSVV
ncbi:MAG: dihydroorotate dehydrogenase-like protein [Anaerolineae bacterium]|nr:dihydroorotate dehydrogenase-like protein [Anaerolineae bacterium]